MLRVMAPLLILHLLGSACSTNIGERWHPIDGKLTSKKSRLFTENKKQCILKIQDAKLAGLDNSTARLAYYHCMQTKGWQLVE